ncbi:MAG: Uncharacterized protein CEN88_460 [Candidatus Berkelbacteria bacterium Licking1014_2]|uniref:Uncharacterized protein n=1 Tax=Candidatus Berkelbacteria bacterium Licking1014_2 TaxID=2017146 RepID=A0A554LSG4_9BACT|nr:MAG: Uncharacterized protein CEN88_460 [Candidatus Berkelbacteria bacterium Licking1014_2]
MLLKIIIFILGGLGCLAIFKYLDRLVEIVGKNSYAEKYLGSGGTYTLWKLIALALAIFGIVYLGS